jgi:hypothetical protein
LFVFGNKKLIFYENAKSYLIFLLLSSKILNNRQFTQKHPTVPTRARPFKKIASPKE